MAYEILQTKQIAFLGAGIIAGVFIERLLKSGAVGRERILATDPKQDRLKEMKERFGILTNVDNRAGSDFGDIIVLAMPPGAVKPVLSESCGSVQPGQIIVSLAAAVPTWLIEKELPDAVPVVRIIPNTPSLIGKGMNPYCLGKHFPDSVLPVLNEFLSVFGESMRLEERLMNAATALTAVGPTYIFPVIATLREASMQLGFTEKEAQIAGARTVLGAASLVLDTGTSPEDLKKMISTQTLNEPDAERLFSQAVAEAFRKISAAEAKLTA